MNTTVLLEQFDLVCSILGYELLEQEKVGIQQSLQAVPMFRCVVETFVKVMRPIVVSKATVVHSFEDGSQIPLDILQTIKDILAQVKPASLEAAPQDEFDAAINSYVKPTTYLH